MFSVVDRLCLLAAFLLTIGCPVQAEAIEISNRYRSPRNPERSVRKSTELIVLHTTEAPARSSLNKLSDRGEAHFCVTEEGSIYAIVDRDREAFHAGRSMWKGKEDVDKFSIGIECVGNHDKAMPMVQLTAIRNLVKHLQAMYKISDECVICHSHVAYGSPNKYHKRRHRGRKRCGMLFAMPSVRQILNLKARPSFDADTQSGRLVVGDDYLRKVLYGNMDTMRGKYAAVAVQPVSAKSSALSIKQLQSRGYEIKGVVSKAKSASKIAGIRWNSPDTYYTIRNKVIPGNAIDSAHIEDGMSVWMKK